MNLKHWKVEKKKSSKRYIGLLGQRLAKGRANNGAGAQSEGEICGPRADLFSLGRFGLRERRVGGPTGFEWARGRRMCA